MICSSASPFIFLFLLQANETNIYPTRAQCMLTVICIHNQAFTGRTSPYIRNLYIEFISPVRLVIHFENSRPRGVSYKVFYGQTLLALAKRFRLLFPRLPALNTKNYFAYNAMHFFALYTLKSDWIVATGTLGCILSSIVLAKLLLN